MPAIYFKNRKDCDLDFHIFTEHLLTREMFCWLVYHLHRLQVNSTALVMKAFQVKRTQEPKCVRLKAEEYRAL